ncbi:unnamed protein product [Adineta ricciae]|uniref:Uncharacterized protein n=1 Tax=Adineta ricciae TaxID=249248 RepID=A0A816BVV0_ADIRI|nr:unnamed protein product [Adineta ricciae]
MLTSSHDLSLLSWNILAPCWVLKEWYPPDLNTETNGLLTLIRRKYHHASQIQVINGILGFERSEAIEIVSIASKNLRLVNVRLDCDHQVLNAKTIQSR